MNIEREKFLNDLLMVRSGLSPREFIEQSSCFVFQDKHVMTFNDEIACQKEVDIDVTGAVQSSALLEILQKLEDDTLLVRENEDGALEFKGKRKMFAVVKDAEIFLPIDKVEKPEKWRELPKEFLEAVGLVQHCVSGDESRFLLTCIHIHPDYVEACDNYQILRAKVSLGLKNSVLVRGSSIKDITQLQMQEVALTKSWIHFRQKPTDESPHPLQYSCRRYAEEYPDLDQLLETKGHPIVLPKGAGKASERAAVFAIDPSGEVAQVEVTLSEGKIRVKGQGVLGWYKEVGKVHYDGPPMTFMISPELLKRISEEQSDARITETKLSVKGARWVYCTVLSKPKEVEEENEEETEKEKPKKERKDKGSKE